MKSKHIYFSLAALIFICSCSKKPESAVDCVTYFVIACQEHDMSKAWDMLSPEAQLYYNQFGEKNRKSGRGMLEHDISEAVNFKRDSDYKITGDSVNVNLVHITAFDKIFDIETIRTDDGYKIKDGQTVPALIRSIAVEIQPKKIY